MLHIALLPFLFLPLFLLHFFDDFHRRRWRLDNLFFGFLARGLRDLLNNLILLVLVLVILGCFVRARAGGLFFVIVIARRGVLGGRFFGRG